jgi:hypothetical protein
MVTVLDGRRHTLYAGHVKAAVCVFLRRGDEDERLLEIGRLQERAFHDSL